MGPAPVMKTSGLYGWEKLPGAPRTPGIPGRLTMVMRLLPNVIDGEANDVDPV